MRRVGTRALPSLTTERGGPRSVATVEWALCDLCALCVKKPLRTWRTLRERNISTFNDSSEFRHQCTIVDL